MSCTKKYFENLSSVDYSLNIIDITLLLSYIFTETSRPWIPLALLQRTTPVGTGVDQYRTRRDWSTTYCDVFPGLLKDCLEASYNYPVANANNPQFFAGSNTDYAEYLSGSGVRSVPNKLVRYQMPGSLTSEFWANMDPATTQENVDKNLNEFVKALIPKIDKRLFVAPGTYYLPDLGNSVVNPIAAAYFGATAQPTMCVLILELNSIG